MRANVAAQQIAARCPAACCVSARGIAAGRFTLQALEATLARVARSMSYSIQSQGRLMSPATWMPRRTPTSTYLAGIIVVFVVAALYWCVRKSVVVVPDLVMEGEPVTPTPLTLFHRLNGLWSSSSRRGIPCLGATRRSLSSSSTRVDARSRLWLCRRMGCCIGCGRLRGPPRHVMGLQEVSLIVGGARAPTLLNSRRRRLKANGTQLVHRKSVDSLSHGTLYHSSNCNPWGPPWKP